MEASTKPTSGKPRPKSLDKWRAIQARFKWLYQKERRRFDDVEQILCDEYFISPARLSVVLRMDLEGV